MNADWINKSFDSRSKNIEEILEISGLPWHSQGKVREKQNFQVQEKVKEFCINNRANTKFYLKVSEKSGYFIEGQPLGLGKGFLVGKGNVVSNDIYIGIDFCGSLLALLGKNLFSVVIKNWFLVRKKREGIFYFFDNWQPC